MPVDAAFCFDEPRQAPAQDRGFDVIARVLRAHVSWQESKPALDLHDGDYGRINDVLERDKGRAYPYHTLRSFFGEYVAKEVN